MYIQYPRIMRAVAGSGVVVVGPCLDWIRAHKCLRCWRRHARTRARQARCTDIAVLPLFAEIKR